jgi:uncharacterized protein YqeY
MSDLRDDLRDDLRGALKGALAARDRTAVAALRSAITALDNAEAVADIGSSRLSPGAGPIAGAATGVGATEVERRRLPASEVRAIVQRQVDERRIAADEYEGLGRVDAADRLRREADVLVAHVPA